MKACSLFSGSSGNSIFLSTEKDSARYGSAFPAGIKGKAGFLVDAGMSGKQLELSMNSIGETLEDIGGLLVTHEHIDHIRGVGVIMRRYNIPLYINQKTWEKINCRALGQIPQGLVNITDVRNEFSLGDFVIKGIKTPHDAADSFGYKITYADKKITVITDIGHTDDNILADASGSDAVFIESNYDEKMLWEGPYPYNLKKRIDGDRGHLSNPECSKAVLHLLKKGTTRFILSHLSKENNLPSKALRETTLKLESEGAIPEKDFLIQVAKRSCASIPWSI